MSTGSSADPPPPPETINTQTARKIRSKLYLPCDVSDGTHVWAERCTATSHSPSLTGNFVRFSVMRTGAGYSISDREQRHAKCCRLSMVAVPDVRRMPHVRFAMDRDFSLCIYLYLFLGRAFPVG